MKTTLIALLTLGCTLNAFAQLRGQRATAYGYGVDRNGTSQCFQMVAGKTVGDPVSPWLCRDHGRGHARMERDNQYEQDRYYEGDYVSDYDRHRGGQPERDYYNSTPGYRLGQDLYGATKCFPTDRNGTVYGSSVSSTFCFVQYRLGNDVYGEKKCFMADAAGTVYGSSVSSTNCFAQYRLSNDVYGQKKCFMADRNNVAYGSSVAEVNCFSHYRAGRDIYGQMRCFKADRNDVIYGSSVNDHLCQQH